MAAPNPTKEGEGLEDGEIEEGEIRMDDEEVAASSEFQKMLREHQLANKTYGTKDEGPPTTAERDRSEPQRKPKGSRSSRRKKKRRRPTLFGRRNKKVRNDTREYKGNPKKNRRHQSSKKNPTGFLRPVPPLGPYTSRMSALLPANAMLPMPLSIPPRAYVNPIHVPIPHPNSVLQPHPFNLHPSAEGAATTSLGYETLYPQAQLHYSNEKGYHSDYSEGLADAEDTEEDARREQQRHQEEEESLALLKLMKKKTSSSKEIKKSNNSIETSQKDKEQAIKFLAG
eukprot:451079-Amorphochlora_amoeboformis.AAC.2